MKHLIFVIMVIFVLSLACSGAKETKTASGVSVSSTNIPTLASTPVITKYEVGQDIIVGNIRWKITEVKNEGGTLKSDNTFIDDKVTSGKFIRVTFEIENQDKEMKTFMGLDLVDDKGRVFKESTDSSMFIEQDKHCIIENLNPNIIKQCQAIFELPSNATGIKANIGDLEMFGDSEALVDLGL